MQETQAQTPAKPEQWSRYQRVKEILNQAQGEASPSYQGYGKFWELPLPEFLTVEIHGVRMIAPGPGPQAPATATTAPPSSCCHAPPAAAPAAASGSAAPTAASGGRGAASGLVRGLRGQCPFDGTQFPRLPWDGAPVSPGDIQFIQDWIDDGCHATDQHRSTVEAKQSKLRARAQGHEEHPQLAGSVNQFHQDQDDLKVRKNINSLTWEELQRFRAAVAQMKSLDDYYLDQRSFGYWARLHADDCQHGWEEFLPWHRVYLYMFEQQLQDIDPTVTLPYWDWTDNSASNIPASQTDAATATPTTSNVNGVIPQAYRCWLNQAGWNTLQAGGVVSAADLNALSTIITKPPAEGGDPKDYEAKTYNSGVALFLAAGVTYGANPASDAAINQVLGQINPLWHRLRWPGGDQNLVFEMYPTSEDIDRISQLANFFTFGSGPTDNQFFGALENIHNFIHNFSGGANPYYKSGANPLDRAHEPQSGDMVSPGVTAYDPIFWGHHSNVDRLWNQWQTMHPGATPDNLESPLPPWRFVVGDTLNAAHFGSEYVKDAHVYPTDNTVPIERFKSAPTPVAPDVLADHRQAVIRLHGVKYAARAGFHVRVFLNSPEADAKTPTRGNDSYVGALSTFFGPCVGGPGHCDPPPKKARKFDRRGRHHKTPGNYQIDATDTVRKLKAKGATSFQVNLVVLNTDGTPATDALLMNGVSLNFVE